jgi:hypothetical protein
MEGDWKWRVMQSDTSNGGSRNEAPELEDELLDEFVAMLSRLSDTQIRALVHARVPTISERKLFESASEGVSRETLTLLAGRCLVRQKLRTIPPPRV